MSPLSLVFLVVGVLAVLLIGLLIGRAVGGGAVQPATESVVEEAVPTIEAATATSGIEAVTEAIPVETEVDAISQIPIQTAAAEDYSNTPSSEMVAFLLEDARHIEGAVDAPITFIEFSDFK
jgi:hypothetical protein